MAKTLKGRASIFRGKDRRRHVTCVLTPEGHKALKKARSRLAGLAKRKVAETSIGDVIEYLARGHHETVDYLFGKL